MRKRIVFSLLILVSGCTEKYDFKFPEQDANLVVEGIVTNGPGPHYVRLTLSKSTFELSYNDSTGYSQFNDGYIPVLDATITISDDSGNTDTLIHSPDSAYRYFYWDEAGILKDSVMDFNPTAHIFGFYQTNSFIGVPGNTYYLKILWKGKEYNSSCFMPPVPEIDSITYEFTRAAIIGKEDFYIPKIWFKDNPATKDYYLFKTGGLVWGRSVLSDINIKSNITGLNVFQGETHEWWLNGYPWPGWVYQIEMSSITKEIYDYYQALIMQFRNDGGVYTPSPASPPTNISNGAQGYFSASSVQVVQDTMPESPK